ncbi:MAG: dockerin type I domain-containing protein [Gemmatimonadales bacterium]
MTDRSRSPLRRSPLRCSRLVWLAALAQLCALSLPGVVAPLAAQDHDSVREDPVARSEWFWAQRTFPGTQRPYDAMLRARLSVMRGSAFSGASAAPLTGAWRPIGPTGLFVADGGFFSSAPQLDAGRIAAIVPAATAGGPMYVGTATGGVWRSTNNGASWTPITDNQCALTTGALAQDPVNPSLLYVGTGEGNQGTFGCGALRSTDGGNTWSTSATNGLNVSGGGVVDFYTIVVDRASAGSPSGTTLLAGLGFNTPGGIARSVNSGANWSLVTGASVGVVTSIVAHPTRAGTYYAGARVAPSAAGRGVYRSTDVGATWSQLPPLPVADPTTIGRVQLAVTPAQPNSLWALVGTQQTGRLLGLFRWDESSNQWTQLAAAGVVTANTPRGDFGGQASYDLVLQIDPRGANRIFVAGVRAYQSSDGGATFVPMANEIHSDWHVLVFDPRNPDIMWAGTDGGVFVSLDAGETWTSRNYGLAITQYYPGVSMSSDGTLIMGGSQDNGTHIFTGGPFWDGFLGGDGGYTAINYKDSRVMWAESQWSPGVGANILRSDATSAAIRTNGIVGTDRASFIPPLVMDLTTPTKLYFATDRLYRTTDEGLTWTPISADLTKGNGVITTVALAKADSNTIYVGTFDGNVQVSRDGGNTFTLSTGLPLRTVTRIVVDPATATHALVTVSGFQAPHIWETTDGAVTWRSIAGNLPDAPANAAVFVGTTGSIFVGTDVGVFQTADDGATWGAGPTGMPNVIIQDLTYQPSANLLLAGTFGRGMFTFTPGGLGAVLRGDVNGDGKIDALDAFLIQEALVGRPSAASPSYPRGDANCNGVLDAGDVLAVLRKAVGLSTGTACVGTTR